MAATLYEETFGKKFNPPPYSLKALFADFERVKNEPDTTLWRLLIAQSLDFYQSNLKWGTLEDAISVYADEPALSGHAGLDAAAAAIALYIADRDDWPAPAWARNLARKSPQPWYVANRPIPRKFADKETPETVQKTKRLHYRGRTTARLSFTRLGYTYTTPICVTVPPESTAHM